MFNVEPIVCDSNLTRAEFSGEILNERSERIGKINLGITFANTPKANLVFLSDSSDDEDDSDDEDFVYKYKNMNNETKNMFKTRIGSIGSRLNMPANHKSVDNSNSKKSRREIEKSQKIDSSSSNDSLPTVIGNESEMQIPQFEKDESESSSVINSDITSQSSQDLITNKSSSFYSENHSNLTVHKSTTKQSTSDLRVSQNVSKSTIKYSPNLSFKKSGLLSSTRLDEVKDNRLSLEQNNSITKQSTGSLSDTAINSEARVSEQIPKKQSLDVIVNHVQIDNIFPLSKKESDHLFGQYSSTRCHDMPPITVIKSPSDLHSIGKRASSKSIENKSITKIEPKKSYKSLTNLGTNLETVYEEPIHKKQSSDIIVNSAQKYRSKEFLADKIYSIGRLNDYRNEQPKQSIKKLAINQSEYNQRKRAVKRKPSDESTTSRSRALITQDSFNEEISGNGLADTKYSIGSINNVIYESTKKSIKNDEDEDLEVTMKFAHENGKISKLKFTLYNDETEKQYTSEYLPNLKADIRRKRSDEITDEATKVIVRLYRTVQEHDGEAAKDSEQFLGKYELILNNHEKKKKYKFHDIGKENLVTVKLSRSYAKSWKKVIDKWQ